MLIWLYVCFTRLCWLTVLFALLLDFFFFMRDDEAGYGGTGGRGAGCWVARGQDMTSHG